MTRALIPAWLRTAWDPSNLWDLSMLKVNICISIIYDFSSCKIKSKCSVKNLNLVHFSRTKIDGDVHSNRIEPLGGNAILNCEVRGDPLPTIQWSKKGINVQISNRIRQLDNGSLAIYGTVVKIHSKLQSQIWLQNGKAYKLHCMMFFCFFYSWHVFPKETISLTLIIFQSKEKVPL